MKRISDLVKRLNNNEAAIVENPINIKYLTGLDIDDGVMFLTKKGSFLLVDDRCFYCVKKTEEFEPLRLTNFKRQMKELETKLKIEKIFLEISYISLKRFQAYLAAFSDNIIDNSDFLDNELLKMRSKKTEEEIKKIKEAQRLTDEGFSYIINNIKPGMSEKEIAAQLESKLILLGSEGRSFDFIVVSGERTALPHGRPSKREIKKGDLITMDFGVKVDGYCSDMTRTISVGKLDSKKEEIYNVVLEAQKLAIKSVKPGIKGKELDKIARDYIANKGYGSYFTHSLGHGVGLDIHELPRLSKNISDIIEEGSVITIEPGIYIPNEFGVRIEDMMLVKEEPEDLTNSDKEIICI